jgi:hypothetical protein
MEGDFAWLTALFGHIRESCQRFTYDWTCRMIHAQTRAAEHLLGRHIKTERTHARMIKHSNAYSGSSVN